MGLAAEMISNPEEWQPLFVAGFNKLTVADLEALFEVNWSSEGSNRNTTEIQTFSWWLDFLLDLEGTYSFISSTCLWALFVKGSLRFKIIHFAL